MANYEYVNNTGVIVPDTTDTLTDVQDEYKTAFGDDDLVVTADTPQGVLIVAETTSRDAVARNNADLANQINPNIAGGVFLDALAALTGLERDSSTSTTVTATLTGVNGTVIPAGTLAETTSGDQFESISSVTIPVTNTIDTVFQSVEKGAIACPASSLIVIGGDGVLGWETITNTSAGVLGTATQSDISFKKKRKRTLALQGVSINEAIISGVNDVDGVNSMTFRENVTSSAVVIDTIDLVSHSIYACVDGGTDDDVATALFTNKSGGAGYNGAVSVTVTDAFSGQDYDVKFDRPTEESIKVTINVTVTNAVNDPTTTVKDAILAYADGETSEDGFVVGANVSLFELSASVAIQTGFFVSDVQAAKVADSLDRLEIPIEIDEKATITSGNITVNVS